MIAALRSHLAGVRYDGHVKTRVRLGIVGAMGLVLGALGCGRERVATPMEPSASSAAPTPTPSVSASSAAAPPSNKDASLRELSADEPLAEGRVAFEGMARPTKGGVDVRGVTLDEGDVSRRLGAQGKGSPDAHFGARLRVVATLEKVESHPKAGEPVMQTRSGTFFVPRAVESITIVKPAEVLEGTLARSKGMFAIGGRMVTSADLDWSLRDAKSGDRVRLWGQPRTYVCPPQAQCLIEGSIPIFDVGRAERLP